MKKKNSHYLKKLYVSVTNYIMEISTAYKEKYIQKYQKLLDPNKFNKISKILRSAFYARNILNRNVDKSKLTTVSRNNNIAGYHIKLLGLRVLLGQCRVWCKS